MTCRNVLHASMKHKEDANDPNHPHAPLVGPREMLTAPASGGRESGEPATAVHLETELAWLREHCIGNPLVTRSHRPQRHAAARRHRQAIRPGAVRQVRRAHEGHGRPHEKPSTGSTIALAGQTVTAPEGWAGLQTNCREGRPPARPAREQAGRQLPRPRRGPSGRSAAAKDAAPDDRAAGRGRPPTRRRSSPPSPCRCSSNSSAARRPTCVRAEAARALAGVRSERSPRTCSRTGRITPRSSGPTWSNASPPARSGPRRCSRRWRPEGRPRRRSATTRSSGCRRSRTRN